MFVVSTRNNSTPPNSVSLVLPVSSQHSAKGNLSETIGNLLAAHAEDFDIVLVCGPHEEGALNPTYRKSRVNRSASTPSGVLLDECHKSVAQRAPRSLEQLAQANPLRLQLVQFDQHADADGALMEGVVRARGRTIVLVRDASADSIARFETLLLSLRHTKDSRQRFGVARPTKPQRNRAAGTRRAKTLSPGSAQAQLGAA